MSSIAEMGRQLRAGQTTSLLLTQAALDRVAALDGALHAFITVTADRAMADARRADAAFAAGRDAGPFQGIPYALKDIYDTAGIRTTCHSRLLETNVPASDCVVAAKLAAAGGVLVGKLATHEFAIGGPSFDLPFPPARNPWNLEHITGGSSSGSGAAVAAGLVRMAMGSDTGGSIRGPAAYCGTVGLKPTYGRVCRRGVFPLSYTLDHCGPLTRSVEDAAITLQAIAGYDALDPASADEAVDDYRAGWRRECGAADRGAAGFFAAAPAPRRTCWLRSTASVGQLKAAGAPVEDIAAAGLRAVRAAGRVIMMAEAFAIHEANLQDRSADYGGSPQRFLLGAGSRRRTSEGVARPPGTDRCGERRARPLRRAVDRVARWHRHHGSTPAGPDGRPPRRYRPSRSM